MVAALLFLFEVIMSDDTIFGIIIGTILGAISSFIINKWVIKSEFKKSYQIHLQVLKDKVKIVTMLIDTITYHELSFKLEDIQNLMLKMKLLKMNIPIEYYNFNVCVEHYLNNFQDKTNTRKIKEFGWFEILKLNNDKLSEQDRKILGL